MGWSPRVWATGSSDRNERARRWERLAALPVEHDHVVGALRDALQAFLPRADGFHVEAFITQHTGDR